MVGSVQYGLSKIINKTHRWLAGPNLAVDCHIRYCWGWSRLPSLATAESDQVREAQEFKTVPSRYCWGRSVDEFCLPVKVSPCRSLFAASQNVASSKPGHGFFACLLIAPDGQGNESHWKMLAWGSGFSHENFSQFHLCWPPEVLRWTFDVEHVDVILGCTVKNRGSMWRLPILVLHCWIGGQLQRVAHLTDLKFSFFSG